MSEFCLECWNKLNETNDSERKYHLSWQKGLCEECGQRKRVIVSMRRCYIILDCLKELRENIAYLKRPPAE